MKVRKFRSPLAAASSYSIRKEPEEGRSLFTLATPIFFEFLMVNIMGNIDIIMLGRYSEEAVGALGGIRQLMLIQNVIFSFICIGTTILISQLLGADRRAEVDDVAGAAIVMNFAVAVFLGAVYIFGYRHILSGMRLPEELIRIIRNYFRLVGGLCIFQAMTLTFSAIMKANGNTRDVFYINFGIHLLNIAGNAFLVMGVFGAPTLGVTGAGISTVAARGAGCIVSYKIMKKYYNFSLHLERTRERMRGVMGKIVTIGFPIGGQHFSWNIAQVVILSFVNTMGADTIEARTYLMLITSFIIASSLGLGQGTALQVGRLVGAGRNDLVYKKCLKSTLTALLIAMSVTGMIIMNQNEIMAVFQPDAETLEIAEKVFVWFLFLESGRVFNIVIIASLHAAGDIKFPAMIGTFSPLIIAVGLAWILGIVFNMGLIGIWAANAIEEWIRGMTMLNRWRSRKWQNKRVT